MDILKAGIAALVASLFCIWLLRPLAMRLGLVDRPAGRKLHEKEVPLIGGIAMFFGFCFALLVLSISLKPYRGILAGSSILLLMGVVDDFRDLSSKLRLCGQLLAALLLIIWGHVLLSNLGNLFFLGDVILGMWAIPLTVFVVVAYINAMNMVDGQDGLAGGVALGQAVLLLMLSLQLRAAVNVRMLIMLIMVLIVFLSFNMRFPGRKHAHIFIGDAGSTFIAYLLAWFAIDLSQQNVHFLTPMTLLWIMSFPIFDLVNVTLLRIRQHKSIITASRDHFHHVLHVAGVNTVLSTVLLCALSMSLGLIGLILNHFTMAEGWQFLFWLLSLGLYIGIVELTRKPLSKPTVMVGTVVEETESAMNKTQTS